MADQRISEACSLSPAQTVTSLAPSDDFLFSTSEFVSPATKAVYVKNKGAYLLFRMPEITSTLVPQMGIWFKVVCFKLGAVLTFRGEIYKVITQDQTAFPCIIVKIATSVEAEPAELEATISGLQIPVVWRKTGSMKQGNLKTLTPTCGNFDTATMNLQVQTNIFLTFSLEGLEYQDLEAVVDRVSQITNVEGVNRLDVNFSFVNQTDSQKDSLSSAIKGMAS